MHDHGHRPQPPTLQWNIDAIAEAAASIGVRDLTTYLGATLLHEPTGEAMSLLVTKLPILIAETVTLTRQAKSTGPMSVAAA